MSRRRLLIGIGLSAGGLTIVGRGCLVGHQDRSRARALMPNVFVHIDPAGLTTIVVPRTEMGQGVRTALAMIVAEELDADWGLVRVIGALADPRYGRMRTGGSTSVRRSWRTLREAGAAARTMLVQAAAREWGVEAETCRTETSHVIGSHGRLRYGDLVLAAARLRVPSRVTLKRPEAFRLIGRSIPRVDVPAKVDGTATFGIDHGGPPASTAMVVRPPMIGGRALRFDATEARAIAGVEDVFVVGPGVAVTARDTWSAWRAKRAVRVRWAPGPFVGLDSEAIVDSLETSVHKPGVVAHEHGDDPAHDTDEVRHEAVFLTPLLAHATMEPMNAFATVDATTATLWVPTQAPLRTRAAVAKALGRPEDGVQVHTTLAGGGFGRRLETDFAVEAALIAKHTGRAVRLLWDREDDFRADFFRPPSAHLLRATVREGRLVSWFHRVAAPTRGAERVVDGLDESAVEGAAQIAYAVPRARVEFALTDVPVPVGSWRAVYHNQNAFAAESFMTELAARCGADPVAFRLAHLDPHSRHARVLAVVAEMAGWRQDVQGRRPMGVAVHESFGSVVAVIIEVAPGDPRLWPKRVFCAMDCGLVVNPDIVRAQVEGSVVFGLSAALRQRITIRQGVVQQRQFSDFAPLRIDETPEVDIRLVPSSDVPHGVGEPAVPPLAPALAGAVWAATGTYVRRLPLVDARGVP